MKILALSIFIFFFFFNDTATTEIYTLSLHDALPIWREEIFRGSEAHNGRPTLQETNGSWRARGRMKRGMKQRSEEHTSELQSQFHLVCRLLLEKKKKNKKNKRRKNTNKKQQHQKYH